MTLPVFLHSAMLGAPTLSNSNGRINAVLAACLVNGFNTQSVVSATASGGVVTFNFASAPGFSALDSVTVAGATNSTVNGARRVQSATGNQVLVAIPGVPDGAVGGTITIRFSPLGWTRPYSGTNVAAYQQGGSDAHKRFLRVFDGSTSTTEQWNARGYGAMTAISTGTDPFPNLTQVPGNGGAFDAPSAGGNRPWWIVGTPRAFYFYYGLTSTTPLATDLLGFAFGDLSRATKPGDTYAQFIPFQSGFPNQTVYLCRSYTGAANTPSSSIIVGPGGAGRTSAGLAHPDLAGGGVTLIDAAPIYESEAATPAVRGFLPGAMCPLNAVPALTTLNNVTGVSGRVTFFRDSYAGGTGCISLLLDEDWGDV